MKELIQIGVVRNRYSLPEDPALLKGEESRIVLEEKFAGGTEGLRRGDFIDVIFLFHKEKHISLTAFDFHGKEQGIFSTRNTSRPSPIGLTTVRIVEIEGRTIRVIGLDALDGSPVLDIKPCDRFLGDLERDIIRGNSPTTPPKPSIL